MKTKFIALLSIIAIFSTFGLSSPAETRAKPTQPQVPVRPGEQMEQPASRPAPGNNNIKAAQQIASPYGWHTFYGSNGDDYGAGVAVAPDGSIYIAGQSNKNWLGPGGEKPLHPFSGDYDLAVLKLDKHGAYQWHSFYGASGMDSGNGVAVGEDGSVYLTGTSSGSWLGEGGKPPLHPYRAGGDLVVIKLDSQGVYQWHTFYGSDDFDGGSGIAVAGDGSIYICEQSYGSWLEEAEAQPRQPEGEGNNLVVLKLNSQGAYQWHRFFGSEGLDFATGVALHGDDNLYLTGYSDSGWLGDGSAEPIHPHSGDFDLVVVKINSQGTYQWHTFYGSGDPDYGESIAISPDGKVYLAGISYQGWPGDGGSQPLHPFSGGTDLVVLKLDDQGNYQWHTFYGSGQDDDGFGIAAGPDGSLYLTGRSYLSWLGYHQAQPLHPFSGGSDLFVEKLDSSGSYLWHTFYGSNDYDSGTAIANPGKRVAYVSGWSYKSWLGDGGVKPLHAYTGGSDLLVMKLTEKDLYYLPMVYGSE